MVVGVVLAAGRGVRLGADRPKAEVEVGGRSLLEWSATALARSRAVAAILPVVADPQDSGIQALEECWRSSVELLPAVRGGATRQASLGCALAALGSPEAPGAPSFVLVHDAARCLLAPELVDAVYEAAQETGAAIPGVPLADSIKRVRDGAVEETLDRESLVAVQTPQAFRFELLVRALAAAEQAGFVGADCASLVERLGVPVRVAAGDPLNFKVTRPDDLERAAALLAERA